jgi:glycosyltransferase involved in cell wall biosynthesis
MVKISIITVCYNEEKTIGKTIESVYHQKLPCYEYIFVDGKSTDRTNEIIEEYREWFEKKGIEYRHFSETDCGIYDAMNKGISMACGDWIGFMNANDYYVDGGVFEDLFEEEPENADFIYGDSMNVKGAMSFRRQAYDIDVLTYRNPFIHQASFIRTDIAKKYMFDLRYRYAADFEQYARMYVDGVYFRKTDRVIAVFNMEGVSNKKNLQTIIEFERARIVNGLGLKHILKRYAIYCGVLVIKNNKLLQNMFMKYNRKGAA